MSKQRRRGAEVSCCDSLTLLKHAQLINERAHILGLQLQQATLATRVATAVRNYGLPTPQEQLHDLLRRGIINNDLASARSEVAAVKTLLERVQSGRLASTSLADVSTGSTVRCSAGRQAGSGGGGSAASRTVSSRQYGALVVDHVRHWLDQAQEAVLMLEDLAAPGSIDEWPLDPPESPPPRSPGGHPVAHFIQRIPPELAALMELPSIPYNQPLPPLAPSTLGRHHPAASGVAMAAAIGTTAATAACSNYSTTTVADAGAGGTSGAVHWDAAPLLSDPSCITTSAPGLYRVACHESAELMWPSLAHGDLVLLLPGRYNWPEGTVLLRAAVRVLGLGRQPSDVVIHNIEEDDVFVECAGGPSPPPPPPLGSGNGGTGTAAATASAGRAAAAVSGSNGWPGAAGVGGGGVVGCSSAESNGVVFENLTLLQLGGYEGALRVLRGRTTLVDVVVQFTMGGLQVNSGAHLVLRNVRVLGGATAGVQVAAGGVLEMLTGCEVTRCGTGDDVVPKDLGGVEVMVPLADYPRLPPLSPRALIKAHAELLTGGLSAAGSSSTPAAATATTAVQPPPLPLPPEAALEALLPSLGAVQTPATVVIGPGCTIKNTRGFAISLVKRRALSAYHELLYSGTGGGGGGHAGHGASGGGGGGSGSNNTSTGCSLSAALEGARVFVSRGSALGPQNSRGAVGVVEHEYHQLDGDAVNRRTASRHFHAVQMTARQLQEGFASPGVDWTSYRIRLDGQPARPGRRATKSDVAAAAAAATGSGGDGGRRGGVGHQHGVVVGTRTLRQLLVSSTERAQRRQRGLFIWGGSGSGSGSGRRFDGDGDEASTDNKHDSGNSGSSTASASSRHSTGGNHSGSGSSSSSDRDDSSSSSSSRDSDVGPGGSKAGTAGPVPPHADSCNGGGGVEGAVIGGQAALKRVCACCGWSPRTAAMVAAVAAVPSEHDITGGEARRRVQGEARLGDSREIEQMGVRPQCEAAAEVPTAAAGAALPGRLGEAMTAAAPTAANDRGMPASGPTAAAAHDGGGGDSEGERCGAGGRDGAATASSSSSVGAGGSGVRPWATTVLESEGREATASAASTSACYPNVDPVWVAAAAEAALQIEANKEDVVAIAAAAAAPGDEAGAAVVCGRGRSAVAESGSGSGSVAECAVPPAAGGTAAGGTAAGGSHGAVKLRRCGGCLAVLYCSKECQRRDWPRHGPICKEHRNATAVVAAPPQLQTTTERHGEAR